MIPVHFAGSTLWPRLATALAACGIAALAGPGHAGTGDDDPGGGGTDPCACPAPVLLLQETDCPLYRGMPAGLAVEMRAGATPCTQTLMAQDWDDGSLGSCGFTHSTGWTPYGYWAVVRDPGASVLNPSVTVSWGCQGEQNPRYEVLTLPVVFEEPLFVDVGTVHWAGPHLLSSILRDASQPCTTRPVRPVGAEPSAGTSFNGGRHHHDVRLGPVTVWGSSTAYAINPQAQAPDGTCGACGVMAEVAYEEQVVVPSVAGTYEHSFPLDSPSQRYEAGRPDCAPSAGTFLVTERDFTVHQVALTNWVHPPYPREGEEVSIGFDITPSDVVWATEESGAAYSVRLEVWDPADPLRRRVFERIGGSGGQVRFPWTGIMDRQGQSCFLTASDYFMRAWVIFEDRYHDDERHAVGPFFHEEERFFLDAFAAAAPQHECRKLIAAGGVATDAHLARIRAYRNPGLPYSMTASLSGGGGGAAFGAAFAGQQYQAGEHRPARLQFGGQTYVAGQTSQPISAANGANATVSMELLSSNRVEDCTVHLSSPELGFSTNITFSFEEGDTEVTVLYQGALPVFEDIDLEGRRLHEGVPLSGHQMGFYAESVSLVDGTTLEFDPLDPAALDAYVQVRTGPNDILDTTDSGGAAQGWLRIVHPYVTSFEIAGSDFTVRKD